MPNYDNDQAVFAKLSVTNTRIRRREAAAIASRRGSGRNLSADPAQAEAAIHNWSTSDRRLSADAEIASSKGESYKLNTDKAHEVFAISIEPVSEMSGSDEAEVAFIRGMSQNDNGEKDHAVIDSLPSIIWLIVRREDAAIADRRGQCANERAETDHERVGRNSVLNSLRVRRADEEIECRSGKVLYCSTAIDQEVLERCWSVNDDSRASDDADRAFIKVSCTMLSAAFAQAVFAIACVSKARMVGRAAAAIEVRRGGKTKGRQENDHGVAASARAASLSSARAAAAIAARSGRGGNYSVEHAQAVLAMSLPPA